MAKNSPSASNLTGLAEKEGFEPSRQSTQPTPLAGLIKTPILWGFERGKVAIK